MKAKLTKTFVDGLEPDSDPKKRRTVWDTMLPAFGVTVTPDGPRGGGVKSYIVQYRVGGRGAKTRRVTIGRHGAEWQPAAAREEAAELLRQVRRGIDPFEERRRAREEQRAASLADSDEQSRAIRLAFPAMIEEFIDEYAKRHQASSWQNSERALKELIGRFGKSRLDMMPRDAIRDALSDIKDRSASAAIASHKALRKLYNWAVDEQIIGEAAHPMRGMKPPAKANVRKRVLTSDELREVWLAASSLGYPFGDHYKLLMLTGQRLREAGEAPWGEFFLDRQVWLIGKERMKREEDDPRGDHLVPLNTLAMELMKGLPRIAPPDGVTIKPADRPVFTTTGVVPISGYSKARTRIDKAVEQARRKVLAEKGEEWDDDTSPMPHWVNHDLRRTMSTALQALGIEEKIIDLLQDHRMTGVSKVGRHYLHWEFHKEKAAALSTWDKYLRGVIFGDKRYKKLVAKVDFSILVPQ